MMRGSRRRSSRRKEGRQGQMTPTSSSMPDQRQTWTMSSVGTGGVSICFLFLFFFFWFGGEGKLAWGLCCVSRRG
jgi:hypothetical protein